jgi:hypothetical protein
MATRLKPTNAFKLDRLLRGAGIPIDGVSEPAGGGSYRIDFLPAATPTHRQQAEAIVATFDPSVEIPEEAAWRIVRENMTPTGFAALNGVQKLEGLRAAMELLLTRLDT